MYNKSFTCYFSPIKNECVKINVTGKYENNFVSKLLLKISFRELHNNMVRPVSQGGLPETRYQKSNIMISDSVI